MIKKASLLGILLCLLSISVFAAEKMDAWNYFARIHVDGTHKYKSLLLTEDVYEHATSGLTDVRIIDEKGEGVPFYIQNGFNSVRQNTMVYGTEVIAEFKIRNDSYTDFRIIPLQKNIDVSGSQLIFELPTGDFLKHIAIYGSSDGEKWEYIGKEYVFREGKRQKNEVTLGNKRKYTYYRIAILDNPEEIVLKKISLSNSDTENQWSGFIKRAQMNFDVSVEKNQSVITVNNKQKLLIKQIMLEVGGDFQRNYKIYGGNKEEGVLKNGEIYNLQLENIRISNTAIDVSHHPLSNQILTIKIDNRDDRPLDIKNVQIEYYVDKLIFPNPGNVPYQLYFGNDKAIKPNYEIELQKEYIDQEQKDPGILEDLQGQEKVVVPEKAMNMKYVFNGSIVLISILLVILLLSRLRLKK